MFGFMTHSATDSPGVSDLFLRAIGVTLLAKTIGKVKGVKVLSGKKAKGHNAILQKGSPYTVIVNERDVFNVPAPFRDGAVINDKVTLFEGVFLEAQFF
jgi:hypothetical protein